VNPPCVIFEDDHLLVVNKPPGLNTHSPSPFAGEGLYEWLKHQERRWAELAIIHRLDKETSGLIVFTKTRLANRSLTGQFTKRSVEKKYILMTDRPVPQGKLVVKTSLVRAGDKYISRPLSMGAAVAQTSFQVIGKTEGSGAGRFVAAEPFTGRTHQIRVQASEKGFPILGDTLYGGSPAPRLCLHSAEMHFQHPASGQPVSFKAPVLFEEEPAFALRKALINFQETTAFRIVHGKSDGWPGWYVDRLGDYLLSQSARDLSKEQLSRLAELGTVQGTSASYHKRLSISTLKGGREEGSPRIVTGTSAPERITVLENGLKFGLSFSEGYSVGLFLDQRDNRRRLLTGHVAAGFELFGRPPNAVRVLNAFAYTCGFSVCTARAGAHTTSLDLSKKYLEWGKTNFLKNSLSPDGHDFIYGDAFDWFKRLGKKGRSFDVIVLDPPTFSRSKESGAFRAETDYGKLVTAALPLLDREGVLFCSCNTSGWEAEAFLEEVRAATRKAKRPITQDHYFPQPPDFPITREEPAYLKTYWARLG
jgi:23S rRNA (cytosine1962-C5)-methyltransferase